MSKKASQSFVCKDEIRFNPFLSRHVRDKKYISACKRAKPTLEQRMAVLEKLVEKIAAMVSAEP